MRKGLILLFLMGSLICSSLSEATVYSFQDLGAQSSASSINNSGQIAGVSNGYAFFLAPGQPMQNLGALGGSHSYASQINNSGQVVGWAEAGGDQGWHARAFLWSSGQPMQNLGTLGGVASGAWGINDLGQVVGFSYPASGGYHAILQNPGQPMQDLGTFGGQYSQYSSAASINNSGQIAGWSQNAAGYEHAFIMNPGQSMQDLGAATGWLSHANAINDSSQVVGYVILMDSDGYRGFIVNPGQEMQLLSTLGGKYSFATDINNAGQVVGRDGQGLNTDNHAVIWENGNIYDLNTLALNLPSGTVLESANSINDLGWIVGQTADGHAFLLTPTQGPSPVPLPGAVWLLGSGLVGLLGFGRSIRRSNSSL